MQDSGSEPAKLRIPHIEAPAEGPPRTVVWFTVDTLNQRYLGHDTFDASPHHDLFFEESLHLPATYVTRGITVESLPSIATGTTPRTHRITDRSMRPVGEMPPTVQEILADEGYATYGYSANLCVMQERGWTRAVCVDGTEKAEGLDDQERDQLVLDEFFEDLAALDADEPAFFWLHLRDPHASYSPRQPWIDEFYDGPREDRSPITNGELTAISKDEMPPGIDFATWLDAVYASQVASSDDMFGAVRAALEDAGRWDIVFTGTDHGEELGEHHRFFSHGCSTYDPVLKTTWAIHAPEVEAARVTTPVSTVDVLPTLLDILDLDPDPVVEGRSLLPASGTGELESVPVFFQRTPNTAGVVVDHRKYFLHAPTIVNCTPEDPNQPWLGPDEGLFDREADPGELENLLDDEPTPPEQEVLCTWVTDFDWGDQTPAARKLVNACELRL